MTNAPHSLTSEMRAALAWWELAGVDQDFSNDPTDWLKPKTTEQDLKRPTEVQTTKRSPQQDQSQTQGANASAAVERVDLLGDSPPLSLAEFQQYWREAPGLDAIGPRGRVPPRGPVEAELMVLVLDPEQQDSGRLLNGPRGRLLSNMLAAMGHVEDETYVASALPRHTPMADVETIAAAGMTAVTLHHIALAAPKRLIVLGANIPPLLGHESPNGILSLPEINQRLASVPLLIGQGLDSMMTMPRLKPRFWRRWIEWSANVP